jgi:hypothetical protein
MSNRDTSPKRTPRSLEEQFLRPWCSNPNQQRLLYFGTVLNCDAPLLEALFFSHMAFLEFAFNLSTSDLERALSTRISILYPKWIRQSAVKLYGENEGIILWFERNIWSHCPRIDLIRNGSIMAQIEQPPRKCLRLRSDKVVRPRPGHFQFEVDVLIVDAANAFFESDDGSIGWDNSPPAGDFE